MNSSSSFKKAILVVGGTGSIGSAVVRLLLADGHSVIILSRSTYHLRAGCETSGLPPDHHSCHWVPCDVTDLGDVANSLSQHPILMGHLNGIVYAVGNCPPGAFDEEIRTPLNQYLAIDLAKEWKIHVLGLHHIILSYLQRLARGGSVVVLSSAITRLTDTNCPPWLHAGHYAQAVAAKNEYVQWLRRDPLVKDKNILIHRVAPAAVNSPFHQRCQHVPPSMVPINDVAQVVLGALNSDEIVDQVMMPPPIV